MAESTKQLVKAALDETRDLVANQIPAEFFELRKFAGMVEQMRAAQIAYFKTKGGLDDCKKIERAVDKWLKEWSSQPEPQAKLF